MDDRFDTPVPPHDETFSFGKVPCRYETGLRVLPDGKETNEWKKGPCPYRDDCLATASKLDLQLTPSYGPCVQTTLAEASSTIVIRSEHQFNRSLSDHHDIQSRHALRKHIYATSPLVETDSEKQRLRVSRRELLIIQRDWFSGRPEEDAARFAEELQRHIEDSTVTYGDLWKVVQRYQIDEELALETLSSIVSPYWCSRFLEIRGLRSIWDLWTCAVPKV